VERLLSPWAPTEDFLPFGGAKLFDFFSLSLPFRNVGRGDRGRAVWSAAPRLLVHLDFGVTFSTRIWCLYAVCDYDPSSLVTWELYYSPYQQTPSALLLQL
jgi:hypothetical protein